MSDPLSQLPPPVVGTHSGPQQPPGMPRPLQSAPVDQRPLVVSLAVCMSTTAAMLFLCAFGFVWMIAEVIRDTFDYNNPGEGVLFHIAERFHLSLMQGLLLPLLAFPLLTVVAGFLLLIRKPWPRMAYSLLGVAALGWASYWQQGELRVVIPAAIYIVFCILIVWHSSASRWYAGRLGNDPNPGRMSP